jgi:hypothetical protein
MSLAMLFSIRRWLVFWHCFGGDYFNARCLQCSRFSVAISEGLGCSRFAVAISEGLGSDPNIISFPTSLHSLSSKEQQYTCESNMMKLKLILFRCLLIQLLGRFFLIHPVGYLITIHRIIMCSPPMLSHVPIYLKCPFTSF